MKTANYPGSILPDPGQVVGPNQLGEYFVGVGDSYRAETDITNVQYEILSEDRKALLTHAARQEFVMRNAAIQAEEEASGFRPIPEWHEMAKFETVRNPIFWFDSL